MSGFDSERKFCVYLGYRNCCEQWRIYA